MFHVRFNPILLFDLLLSSRSLLITSAYYDQAFCFVKKNSTFGNACMHLGKGERGSLESTFSRKENFDLNTK